MLMYKKVQIDRLWSPSEYQKLLMYFQKLTYALLLLNSSSCPSVIKVSFNLNPSINDYFPCDQGLHLTVT